MKKEQKEKMIVYSVAVIVFAVILYFLQMIKKKQQVLKQICPTAPVNLLLILNVMPIPSMMELQKYGALMRYIIRFLILYRNLIETLPKKIYLKMSRTQIIK